MPTHHLHLGELAQREGVELRYIALQPATGAQPVFQVDNMVCVIERAQFPDGHGSRSFLFRVGE